MGSESLFKKNIVWKSGEDNAWPYHVYGLTRTKVGNLLAFAEVGVAAGYRGYGAFGLLTK